MVPASSREASSYRVRSPSASATAARSPSGLTSISSRRGPRLRITPARLGLRLIVVRRLPRVSGESHRWTASTASSSARSYGRATSASAATRRASATPASSSARPRWSTAIADTITATAASDRRDRHEPTQAHDRSPLAPDLRLRRPEIGLLARDRRLQEGGLDRREVGARPLAPRPRRREAWAPVELGRRPTQGVPTGRRRPEVAEDPQALHVLVEPLAQAGPGARRPPRGPARRPRRRS